MKSLIHAYYHTSKQIYLQALSSIYMQVARYKRAKKNRRKTKINRNAYSNAISTTT